MGILLITDIFYHNMRILLLGLLKTNNVKFPNQIIIYLVLRKYVLHTSIYLVLAELLVSCWRQTTHIIVH